MMNICDVSNYLYRTSLESNMSDAGNALGWDPNLAIIGGSKWRNGWLWLKIEWHFKTMRGDTVDGRNPKQPPGMYKAL